MQKYDAEEWGGGYCGPKTQAIKVFSVHSSFCAHFEVKKIWVQPSPWVGYSVKVQGWLPLPYTFCSKKYVTKLAFTTLC